MLKDGASPRVLGCYNGVSEVCLGGINSLGLVILCVGCFNILLSFIFFKVITHSFFRLLFPNISFVCLIFSSLDSLLISQEFLEISSWGFIARFYICSWKIPHFHQLTAYLGFPRFVSWWSSWGSVSLKHVFEVQYSGNHSRPDSGFGAWEPGNLGVGG